MPPRKGYKQSEEHIAKRTSALIGKRPSDACIAAAIVSSKTRVVSKETRQKMSISHTGKRPSEDTRKQMSEWQRLEKGPRWIDGRSSPRGIGWRWIRLQILERDNNTCQSCGNQKRYLQVHHLIPWEISHDNCHLNLITLCCSCHNLLERKKICLLMMEIAA